MKTDNEYLNDLHFLFDKNKEKIGTVISRWHHELRDWIISKTEKLNLVENCTLSTRIYWILNDIHDFPRCRTCGNKLMINASVIKGYAISHCSNSCAQLDGGIQLHKKQTCIDRFGVEYSWQAESVKNHIDQTMIKKYGVKRAMCSKDLHDKFKKTNLNKYGVEWHIASDEIRDKTIKTNIKKFGSENVFGSVYGKEKIKRKINKKFNVDFFPQSKEFKDACIKTCQKNWGVDYYFQSDDIKQKSRDTNRLKYGVDHPSQSPDIMKKIHSKYVYGSISFDSAPELAYYIWLTDHNVQFECSPAIRIQYEFNGKKHFYMPDFIVDGQLIELKGDHFFNENGEMVNPFRYPDWSDEQYKQSCALYEAKHQCMLNNNVKILKSDDYSLYIRYIENKYGKDFLKQFKNDNTKI